MATGIAVAKTGPPGLDKVCGGARAVYKINDDVIQGPQATHSGDDQSLKRSSFEPEEEDDKHQSQNTPDLGGGHIAKEREQSMQAGEFQTLNPAGNSHIEGKGLRMVSDLEREEPQGRSTQA